MQAFRVSTLFLLSLIAASPVQADPRPLIPGRLVTELIPEVLAPRLFNGDDGFVLDIPEDAVRVEIELTTAPPEANINLYGRYDDDVEGDLENNIFADIRSENPGGVERLLLTENTPVPLRAGRLFVSLSAGFRNPQTFAFLEVSVELTPGAGDLTTIAASDFEAGMLNGWARNFPFPDPAVPGATSGSSESRLAVVRGPLDLSRNMQLTSEGDDYFVAPPEYLGKLKLLGPSARLEFDLGVLGTGTPNQPAEVRLIGPFTTWRWTGAFPNNRTQRFIVPIDGSTWQRISGSEDFDSTLDNVLRIEIRANYGLPGAVTFLDNVVLLGKAEAPATPLRSTFDTTTEGWVSNFPDAPFLIPRILGVTQGDFRTASNGVRVLQTAGNPGGFFQVRDLDDVARDAVVAPDEFLGNWATLGTEARLEFDRKHDSNSGASRGVEVRILGFGGAYSWIGPPPRREWSRYVVPLRSDQWVSIDGDRTFEEVLRAVQRVEITMDEVVGPEDSGIDNVSLIVPPPIVPELSAAPAELVFSATQGGSAVAPKAVAVSSNGPILEWIAAASASAPWIRLPEPRGSTPGELVVMADPAGLPSGIYRGTVEIAWAGSTRTVSVPVTFNVVSSSGPLLSEGGIVNAATYAPNGDPGGELAGGMYFAAFGERLSDVTLRASTVPLPTELANVTVSMGGIPAPLVFVSGTQIVGVVPQGLTQGGQTAQSISEVDVLVIRDGEVSAPERIRLTAVRPVLFSQDQTGSGPGAILNLAGSTARLNTFQSPARPTQALSLFGSGFGPTQTFVPDGAASSGANPVTAAVRVRVGGRDAEVLFAGLSVSPHLYQANIILPADSEQGCEVPVQILIDGVASNVVSIALTENGEPCR